MADLYYNIKNYGNPIALIDHWNNKSERYAIWDFEEIFFFNHTGININGKYILGDPLSLLQKKIDEWKQTSSDIAAIGGVSYDFKNHLFPHLNLKKISSNFPYIWFGKPKKVISYDLNLSSNKKKFPSLNLIKDIPNIDCYKRSIYKIKEHICNGDTYQINFTNPKTYELNESPLDFYLKARDIICPYYGFYLDIGNYQILSFSPERFFNKTNDVIESLPMKGTNARSKNLEKDKILAQELFNSEKDRAEHLMIVDLIRNDLGKICEYGSIKVENLFGIQSFKTVHQMVTKVLGKLNKQIKEIDILSALFPGGSITGAPKERSIEIIDSIENYQRKIYTGALGYIKSNGDMDFNIAIRTMLVDNNQCEYPVGGGIIFDSETLSEWNEAQQKGKIIDQFTKKNHKIIKESPNA